MDITLTQDFKPDISSDTSFDELVAIAEKIETIAHSIGLDGTRNQQTNPVLNAVTQPRPKDSRNNHQGDYQRSSNNTSSPTECHPMRKKDAEEKEDVTIVER